MSPATQHTAPKFNFQKMPIFLVWKRATLHRPQKQAYLPSPRLDPTHNTTHSPLVASRALFKAHSHIGEGGGICDGAQACGHGPGSTGTHLHNAHPPAPTLTHARIYNILIYTYFTRARYIWELTHKEGGKRERETGGGFSFYIFFFLGE